MVTLILGLHFNRFECVPFPGFLEVQNPYTASLNLYKD
jgi:hypothetical protein